MAEETTEISEKRMAKLRKLVSKAWTAAESLTAKYELLILYDVIKHRLKSEFEIDLVEYATNRKITKIPRG